MERPRDCWIVRNPPISAADWAGFVASRDDLEAAKDLVGNVPSGKDIELQAMEAHWWLGHSQGELAMLTHTNGSVHVSGIDDEGLAFANEVARCLGAGVEEV